MCGSVGMQRGRELEVFRGGDGRVDWRRVEVVVVVLQISWLEGLLKDALRPEFLFRPQAVHGGV